MDYEENEMKTKDDFVACGACNRGGNGNDKDKCACGWQIVKIDGHGCFLGSPIEGPIKPQPKVTRSGARYLRYLEVRDCFESFIDFVKYDCRKKDDSYENF